MRMSTAVKPNQCPHFLLAAPYVRVREQAREELNELIGITDAITSSDVLVSPRSPSRKLATSNLLTNKLPIKRGPFEGIPLANLSTSLQQHQTKQTSTASSSSLTILPPGVQGSLQPRSSTPEKEEALLPQARVQYV